MISIGVENFTFEIIEKCTKLIVKTIGKRTFLGFKIIGKRTKLIVKNIGKRTFLGF